MQNAIHCRFWTLLLYSFIHSFIHSFIRKTTTKDTLYTLSSILFTSYSTTLKRDEDDHFYDKKGEGDNSNNNSTSTTSTMSTSCDDADNATSSSSTTTSSSKDDDDVKYKEYNNDVNSDVQPSQIYDFDDIEDLDYDKPLPFTTEDLFNNVDGEGELSSSSNKGSSSYSFNNNNSNDKDSDDASNSSNNITVAPTTTTKTLKRKLPSSSSSSGDTTINVDDDATVHQALITKKTVTSLTTTTSSPVTTVTTTSGNDNNNNNKENDVNKTYSTSPSGNNGMSSLSSKTSLMKKAPPAAATTTMRKKAPPLTSNTFDDGTTTITTTTTTVPPQVDKTKSTRGPYQKKRKITEEENKSKVVRSYNTKSRGPRGPYQKKKAPPAAATTTMRKKAPPLTSTTFDDVAEEDNRTAKIIRDLDERTFDDVAEEDNRTAKILRDLDERIAVASAEEKIRDDKKAETERKRAEGNEKKRLAAKKIRDDKKAEKEKIRDDKIAEKEKIRDDKIAEKEKIRDDKKAEMEMKRVRALAKKILQKKHKQPGGPYNKNKKARKAKGTRFWHGIRYDKLTDKDLKQATAEVEAAPQAYADMQIMLQKAMENYMKTGKHTGPGFCIFSTSNHNVPTEIPLSSFYFSSKAQSDHSAHLLTTFPRYNGTIILMGPAVRGSYKFYEKGGGYQQPYHGATSGKGWSAVLIGMMKADDCTKAFDKLMTLGLTNTRVIEILEAWDNGAPDSAEIKKFYEEHLKYQPLGIYRSDRDKEGYVNIGLALNLIPQYKKLMKDKISDDYFKKNKIEVYAPELVSLMDISMGSPRIHIYPADTGAMGSHHDSSHNDYDDIKQQKYSILFDINDYKNK